MILFLDIDGVFIPGRAYMMPGQTRPLVTKFDPCAVGLVNHLCNKFGAKLVIHSSWLRSPFALTTVEADSVKDYMVNEGLKAEHFHKEYSCFYRFSGDRWTAISDWLYDHPTKHWWVLEDEPCAYGREDFFKGHLIGCDFQEGITYEIYWRLFCAMEKAHENMVG